MEEEAPKTKLLTIAVPDSLRMLIEMCDKDLDSYKQSLLDKIVLSSKEMMMFLNLKEQDGWVLNMDQMRYEREVIETPPKEPPQSEK